MKTERNYAYALTFGISINMAESQPHCYRAMPLIETLVAKILEYGRIRTCFTRLLLRVGFTMLAAHTQILENKVCPADRFASKATLFIFLASLTMPQDFILNVALAG